MKEEKEVEQIDKEPKEGLIDLQKKCGKVALFLWFAIGSCIFIANSEILNFFTWQGLAYFAIGLFIAPLLIGGIFYFIQRSFTKEYISISSRASRILVIGVDFFLMIAEAIIVYYIARWTIFSVLFPV